MMLFTEYYHSALRHLDVCKLMLNTLSSMKDKKISDKKQRLMLDIYYLIGCPVRCSEKQMLKSPVKLLI